MKIRLDSPINKYYVQTLGMIFFPGEKFGDGEPEEGEPYIYLTTSEDSEGVRACATVGIDGKEESDEYFAPFTKDRTAERTMKLAIGGAILHCAGKLLGYRPSWGMMIGVRPSKVASEMLEGGYSKTKVKRTLASDYFVIPKKAELATSIALKEKSLIGVPSPKDCSIYISIPFCPSRCTYCSFVSYTSKRLLSLIPQYLEKLKTDIDSNINTVRRLGLNIRTVYIGGGTPTILDAEQLRDLLGYLASRIDISALEEFTLEAGRPDTITAEKLAVAKEYGVTRISVNPQSLCDDVLCGVGRNHTAAQFHAAYEMARASGIKTVNVDLIAGLPGDNFEIFSKTVDEILSLTPQNITVHTFCVKKSADVLRQNSHIYSARGGDVGKCIDYSQIRFKESGYDPYYMYRQKNTVGNYENVGFSIPGHEGMYNIYMMEEVHSIFASGAGAVSKLVDNTGNCCNEREIERLFHQKYPYEYLKEEKDGSFTDAAVRFYTEHGMI